MSLISALSYVTTVAVIAQIVVAVGVFLIGAGVGIFVVFLLEKRAKKKTELKSTYTEINRIQVDNSPKIQKDTPIEELTSNSSFSFSFSSSSSSSSSSLFVCVKV
jgi:beta-lactamase regulating signal transducer with metallopeptidase domain